MSIRKRISDFIYPHKETEIAPVYEKLSATRSTSTGEFSSALEERRQSTVSKEQLETLYHVDGLCYRIVNKYTDSMIGPGYYFEGKSRSVKLVEEWSDQVRLKRILEEIVKDIYVTGSGNAWCELGYTKNDRDIVKLRIINPKTEIDYIRDKDGNVMLDEHNEPVGFKQERNVYGSEVIWKRDNITVAGKTTWTRKKKNEDGRDRIAHFKLYGLGESYLGHSPLETVFKDCVIRLNLTDNVGEMGYRGGAIVGYVGEEGQPASAIPDKTIDKLANDLKNATHEDVFVFKRNVKLDNFPIPDLKGREELIYYFVDVMCSSLGVPLVLLMEPKTAYKGEVEFKAIEFEKTVMNLQEKLAEQIEDKILTRLFKARGLSLENMPKMKFRNFQPAMRLSKSRRIGKYVKDGVLHWDINMENQIRHEEGFEEFKGEIPIPKKKKKSTTDDIITRVDEVIDKLEEV